MQLGGLAPDQIPEAIDFYARVFAASEGEEEGASIGALVADLFGSTAASDLHVFAAQDGGRLCGCIVFSRMTVPGGAVAFILSPVAVATAQQGTGIGQELINYGIGQLKEAGADLLFTYGDPRYYCKVGFQQISEDVIQAPQPLSMPFGWQAQSLSSEEIKPLEGTTRCVPALNKPEYW